MAKNNDKGRGILRWVFGGFLFAFAVIMLLSFVATVTVKGPYGYPLVPITAPGVIIWWIVILGAGVPGTLLLLRSIRNLKKRRPNKDDEKQEEEDNSEE